MEELGGLQDLFTEFRKSQQGSTLAMGAIAETLNKMNSRLEKQEMGDEKKALEKAMEIEKEQTALAKQDLVKEIASSVFSALQKENMELNADKFHTVKHKDVFNAEGGDEDKQVAAKLRTDTKEVQRPIQAMLKELLALNKHFLKEHADLYENDNEKEEVLGGEKEAPVEFTNETSNLEDGNGMEDEKGSTEFPMEEDEWKDKDMYKMFKSLQKEMISLKKSFDTEVEKKATKIAEATLTKQGWHKEVNRQPRLIKDKTMGLDENPIVKSKSRSEIVEQLSELSWSEITNMRAQKAFGNTEGLPIEVLG